MNDPNKFQVVIAGLPKTGKTTFLALIYSAIVQGRCEEIDLAEYDGDRAYMNSVASRLLQCEEAKHTEVNAQGHLRLSLLVGGDGRSVDLEIPDLSGETWDTVLYNRVWPRSLQDLAQSAQGVMVFLHVQEFDSAPSIAHVKQATAALLGEETETNDEVTEEGETNLTTNHQLPTQVQLVDLISLLQNQAAQRRPRVGVVLSAWDLVDDRMTPDEWLDQNAPLAAQYLSTNRHSIDIRVWGVSAQGGRFSDPTERDKLIEVDLIDRARAVSRDGTAVDLETPFLWVAGLDTE